MLALFGIRMNNLKFSILANQKKARVARKLKISRIALRKLASEGKIPGMVKSSW